MSIPSDTFEEQLRQQLHTTTPVPYAGLDPSAVIGAGERVVRRRRLGTALVAAVAVAAVALGANLLGVGRPAPPAVPAAPSTVAPMTATLHLGGFQGQPGNVDCVVTLHKATDGALTVDYSARSSAGGTGIQSSGEVLDPSDRRISWVEAPNLGVVVGLIPAATAQHTVDLQLDRDYGSYTSEVEPLPGTDYLAFAVRSEKPLTGDRPVVDVRWYDHAGRPVGKDGRVGSSASVDGRTAWVTADGKTMGVLDEGSAAVQGRRLPSMVVGEVGATSERMHLTIFGPSQAASATATLSDGQKLTLLTAPLSAQYSVSRVSFTVSKGQRTDLVRYSWTDAQGGRHDVTP